MKEKKVSVKAQEKFKELIKKAKKQGLVKSHVDAFQDVPVKNEKHKGNSKYFFN